MSPIKLFTDVFKSNSKGSSIEKESIFCIPCDLIRPNRSQPRADFKEDALIKLADSIKKYGIIQPLSVRKAELDDIYEYELIAGERRLRAAKLCGLYYVPCIVVDADASESAEIAIIENMMREDLNMFEAAYALRNLTEDFELTQEEVARRLSMSQSAVANKIRLLKLDYEEQRAILALSLSERHARALLKLDNHEQRMSAIYRIADRQMNVRDAEDYISFLCNPEKKANSQQKIIENSDRSVSSIIRGIQKRLDTFNKNGHEAVLEIDDRESKIELRISIPK